MKGERTRLQTTEDSHNKKEGNEGILWFFYSITCKINRKNNQKRDAAFSTDKAEK